MSPIIQCKKKGCRQTFNSYEQRKRHMKTCTNPDLDSDETVEKLEDDTFVCIKCKGKISQRNNIKRHEKICKGEKPKHVCNLCDKTFIYKSKRDRHVEQVHNILSQNGDESFMEESDEFVPSFMNLSADTSLSVNDIPAPSNDTSATDHQPPAHSMNDFPPLAETDDDFISSFTDVITPAISNAPTPSMTIDESSCVTDTPPIDIDAPLQSVKSYSETQNSKQKRVNRKVSQLQTVLKTLPSKEQYEIIKRSLDLTVAESEEEISYSNCETIFEGKMCAGLLKHLKMLKSKKDLKDIFGMLNEMFDNLGSDLLFLRWIAKKLDYRQNFFLESFLKWQNNNFLESRGRSRLPVIARESVWDFWHEMSTASTLTSRPAKLKVADRPKIQLGLKFSDSVTTIEQRNKRFYQSTWNIIDITYRELYQKYTDNHTGEYLVSLGSFVALKPFYVRSATDRDLEYCCCKKHLHARWAIQALIECAGKQNIEIGSINNYDTFFSYLTLDCNKEPSTYVSWTCMPNKKVVCEHIFSQWDTLKTTLLSNDDKITFVPMQLFEKEEVTTKGGETSKRLKLTQVSANLGYITDFISGFLPSFIHHRNQLKHYRSSVHSFRECYESIFIDIDFSENLSVPVRQEIQSLHWSHEQVTVHSGIMKQNGEKSYHPYISNDKKHDQHFVHVVLDEMLGDIDCSAAEYIVIESDNCSCQYKSCTHFESVQRLCNKYDTKVIRIFGIPEHGKGEVDHVGGTAKTTIRRGVVNGIFFDGAQSMVTFLNKKFGDKKSPKYVLKEITLDSLEIERNNAKYRTCSTIDGSSLFQVMVFCPNSETIKASPRLCVCDECKTEYGSCSLFTTYELQVCILKEPMLRSQNQEPNADTSEKASADFLLPGSICAVAAAKKSSDTVFFIHIIDEKVANDDNVVDEYGHKIAVGSSYLTGHYFEKDVSSSSKHGQYYRLMKKIVFFYKESVVYPFVNLLPQPQKQKHYISNIDFNDVVLYAENSGMSFI